MKVRKEIAAAIVFSAGKIASAFSGERSFKVETTASFAEKPEISAVTAC